MSGPRACKCGKKRRLVCTRFMQRHSAFDGYRAMASDWSDVYCLTCGSLWRTSAAYVGSLPRMNLEEAFKKHKSHVSA